MYLLSIRTVRIYWLSEQFIFTEYQNSSYLLSIRTVRIYWVSEQFLFTEYQNSSYLLTIRTVRIYYQKYQNVSFLLSITWNTVEIFIQKQIIFQTTVITLVRNKTFCLLASNQNTATCSLKGTVSRDFYSPIWFH